MNIFIALASLVVAVGGAKSGSTPCTPGALLPHAETSPLLDDSKATKAHAVLAGDRTQRGTVYHPPIVIAEAKYACTLQNEDILDRGNPY